MRSGWSGQCEEGLVLFCMIVKTVCSRSNEYFWRALPLCFFSFVFLFLTSIIRSVAMHAFVREEGCQSRESFHLCMNSNHSAGGGRWKGEEDGEGLHSGRRKELWCYLMRGDRSDEESQQRSSRECLGVEGRGEASGPRVASVCFNNRSYLCSVPLWSL